MRAAAIDIGNTWIKAGLFNNQELISSFRCAHSEFDLLQKWLSNAAPDAIIHSSTASKNKDVRPFLPKNTEVTQLDVQTVLPIIIDYKRETLGLDRVANAVAGHKLNPKASLVIDAGTCVTFDWTAEGVYLGGGISPGLHMRFKAMHSFTGRLPLISEHSMGPLIGKNTHEAMNSGAYHGLLLEINGVISEFTARYPMGTVYLTGGDALLLAGPIENDIFADPLLTLYGLMAILEYTHA